MAQVIGIATIPCIESGKRPCPHHLNSQKIVTVPFFEKKDLQKTFLMSLEPLTSDLVIVSYEISGVPQLTIREEPE